MEQDLVVRLVNLAELIASESHELVELLRMPQGEDKTGDLALLDVREWVDLTTQAQANLAFTMVRVQGALEGLQKGGAIGQSGIAGVSESAHPFGSTIAG